MLITSRSFEEYQQMFGLRPSDLRLRVLDCPAGAAAFSATVRREAGGVVIAVDPAYARRSSNLTRSVQKDVEQANTYVRENADQYNFSVIQSVDDHLDLRERSSRLFLSDIASRPGTYVAAALPLLPFKDGSFDLVLLSHLLFTHGHILDHEFHLFALAELIRVSQGEVRVFPLVDLHGQRYAKLDELRQDFTALSGA